MSTKVIATIVFTAFILILVGGVYYFQPSLVSNKSDETIESPVEDEENKPTQKPESAMKVDRIQIIEDAISELKKDKEKQDDFIVDLSEKVNDLSTSSAVLAQKKILATADNQGGVFTTNSNVYTPMSMFVNISCSKNCNLWINYYTSSKNDSANNINTYGIFLNGQDQGIFSQATSPNANGSSPISLNASLPASAGTHTVEIKAKTSAGTLQSDVSFLQVMAIEQ